MRTHIDTHVACDADNTIPCRLCQRRLVHITFLEENGKPGSTFACEGHLFHQSGVDRQRPASYDLRCCS